MSRVVVGVSAVCALIGVLFVSPAFAGNGDVELIASIDGEALADADFGNPLVLGDASSTPVEATIVNNSTETVEVRRIRLDGTAFGISFLTYDTVLPFSVDPGASQAIRFELAIDDLPSQASGLIPASLAVFDVEGTRVASQAFTLDVDGRATSVMSIFAGLVGVMTLVGIALNAYLIVKRKLPPNRVVRGIRFVMPGLGLGLFLALIMGIGRIVAPYRSIWPFLLLVPGVASFLLGYISPGALDLTDDVDEFDDIAEPAYRI